MFSSTPALRNDGTSDNTKLRVVSKAERTSSPKGFNWQMLFLLIIGIAVAYHIYNEGKEVAPGVIETPEGDLILSPKRQAKLDRELEEIDNAVQYVLIADESGLFPCYSCPNGQLSIFLNVGETWKIGVTRKGDKDRYPDGNYGAPNLLFVPEFEGDYAACLKMKKIRIYNYPFMPEGRDKNKCSFFRFSKEITWIQVVNATASCWSKVSANISLGDKKPNRFLGLLFNICKAC